MESEPVKKMKIKAAFEEGLRRKEELERMIEEVGS